MPLSPGTQLLDSDDGLWQLAEEVIAGPIHESGDAAVCSSNGPCADDSDLTDSSSEDGSLCRQLSAPRPPPLPESSVLQHNLALSLGGGGVDAVCTVLELLDREKPNTDRWRVLQSVLSRHYRRALCDEARTAAFGQAAVDAALRGNATVLFLGVGSFVPALHAARIAGDKGNIVVLEPSKTLRRICEVALRANGLDGKLRVCATAGEQPLTSLDAYAALGSGTYTVLCEAVGEGLVTERLCEILAAARAALDNAALGRTLAAVEPSHATLVAAPLQLRTEAVEGFDLSAFNALRRTQSESASVQFGPGWMPVRLDRQPLASVGIIARPQVVWELSFMPGPAWSGQPPAAAEAVWDVTQAGHLCGFASWFQLRIGKSLLSSAPECAKQQGSPPAHEREQPSSAEPQREQPLGAEPQRAPPAVVHGWKQALNYLGSEWPVDVGAAVRAALVASLRPSTLRFELRSLQSSCTPVPEPLASLAARLPPGAALPVQSYHFTMLADERRNAAFCAAVQLAVESLAIRLGRAVRVLDLGCGTGLLGLAAARVGARVWAVEMNPLLRTVAAECASRNLPQLSGSLVVLPAAVSTQLQVGRDLPHKVDLVVSEVLDSELVTEGVLASLRHARAELLMAGGVLLPRGATVFVAPVECFPIKGATNEFDLSALDELCCSGCYQPLRLENVPHRLLGPPTTAFEIDFQQMLVAGAWATLQKCLELRCELAGTVSGLAWWFDVSLAAGMEAGQQVTLSSGPGGGQRTWKQNCRFLQKAVHVQPGEILHAVCRVTEAAIFWELRESET